MVFFFFFATATITTTTNAIVGANNASNYAHASSTNAVIGGAPSALGAGTCSRATVVAESVIMTGTDWNELALALSLPVTSDDDRDSGSHWQ